MQSTTLHWPTPFFSLAAALLLVSFAGAHGQSKTLAANTRFFVPVAPNGAVQQVGSLLLQGHPEDALLITVMETVPQAVWLTSGKPSQASATVASTLLQANVEGAVPVLVLYNIPGRDCGSYSAGGAENTADYEAWIDAISAAIARQKVVIVLEPDALADLPSDCGYDPTQVNIPQATADRYTQINYAVTKLETGSQTLVYLDAGNSHWQSVGFMAARLAQAGVQQAQGFLATSRTSI
jgi:endoglucanase